MTRLGKLGKARAPHTFRIDVPAEEFSGYKMGGFKRGIIRHRARVSQKHDVEVPEEPESKQTEQDDIDALEAKIQELQNRKTELFAQLKRVLAEDEEARVREEQRLAQYACTPHAPHTALGITHLHRVSEQRKRSSLGPPPVSPPRPYQMYSPYRMQRPATAPPLHPPMPMPGAYYPSPPIRPPGQFVPMANQSFRPISQPVCNPLHCALHA